MKKLATINLHHDSASFNDVQLWSSTLHGIPALEGKSFAKIDVFVDYTAVPLYVIQNSTTTVYSDNEETSSFFKSNLVSVALAKNNNVGLLFKDPDSDLYLIFYYADHIHMLVLDFGPIAKLQALVASRPEPTVNTFVEVAGDVANTKVFDKVLERKKKADPFLDPKPSATTSQTVSGSVLTTQEQINSAISKVIMSGLRIRGLSTNLNHSINDKLTIKEIFQMTHKAAVFSLRKYNYGFKGPKAPSHELRINHIQDIVESLLEIFVDIN